MATLAITFTTPSEAGALLRRLAKAIEIQASVVPDKVGTGADVVLTINNAPATGNCSVQLTGGPYQNAAAILV